jgi:hypothetical protein
VITKCTSCPLLQVHLPSGVIAVSFFAITSTVSQAAKCLYFALQLALVSQPILVTGSSGYIAQHVIEEFLSNGLQVVGIDSKVISGNTPIKNKFKHSKIAELNFNATVSFFENSKTSKD